MDQFNGQVAVVTGAASGIGCAIARALIEKGARVALLDNDYERLAREFKEVDGVALWPVDITCQSLVQETIFSIESRFGKIDILVHSAGITGKTNVQTHRVCDTDLRNVFEVNFMGGFYIARAVLPGMLEKKYGRILYLASIAGKEGNEGMLAYSASKAAVVGMAKVQGKEYAQTGITVNAMAPGVIRTALVEAMPESQVKYMTDKIPMKRCGTLGEAAHLATFIVSKENGFTTGFTYDLSGGRATY